MNKNIDQVISKDRLYNLLVRGRKVTQARLKKHGKFSVESMILKTYSEVTEVQSALRNADKRNFLEENCDVIFCALTNLHLIEFTDDEITAGLEECMQKLEKRIGLRDY